MLQEDSNGDTSFEIIDKKTTNGKSESTTASSISSSAYSIPSPTVLAQPVNLLSNIPPPSNLPDISVCPNRGAVLPAPTPLPANVLPPSRSNSDAISKPQSQYLEPQFNPAIPPSKGIQHGIQPQSSQETPENAKGLIHWMKDAVSSGGILSKVAEKAKNSVDSIITTLDPQMSEYLNSSGDVAITVASQNPSEITMIREAVHSMLGKAVVNGIATQIDATKHVSIGFETALQRAKERCKIFTQGTSIPTVVIEPVLILQDDSWISADILLLQDDSRHITLHTFTQGTIIPYEVFLKEAKAEMPVYAQECQSVEKLLSAYMKMKAEDWKHNICGVTRKETILLAAKSLLGMYKSKISDLSNI